MKLLPCRAMALTALIGWCVLSVTAQDAVLTYQGRVQSGGMDFTGTGQFKFALVTATNTAATATATANLTGGFVTSYTVTFGGNGYVSPPGVTVTGGGGSGATATATVLGGVVTGITPGSAGNGYTSPPTVIIEPPPDTILYTSYWSNDGTSSAGSEPVAAVAVPVDKGLFTVRLGDTGLANMTAVQPVLFSQPGLKLRIWFSDGLNGFEALTPVQPLAPPPYSLLAGNLVGTLPGANLAGTYANAVTFNNPANSFTGNGTGLNGLNASQLASGTVPDARLSSNVARTDQVWLLSGNEGTAAGKQFLGTTDKQPLELSVNSARAFRLEPRPNTVNLIGGFSGNGVTAGAEGSTIAGGGSSGFVNVIAADYATIGGGINQRIGTNATASTIVGGASDQIQDAAVYAAIGGGSNNVVQYGAIASTIGGGQNNTIQSNTTYGVIAGGHQNQIFGHTNQGYSAQGAAILGGYANTIETYAYHATIGGGAQNRIQYDGDKATIGGGLGNNIGTNANYATIGGGANNWISNQALYATIPGGNLNVAGQGYAFAAGNRAKAIHQGTFVWSDSQTADFSSTGTNQFLIRAAGNVGINKNNPGTALDVNGAVTAANFVGSGAGLTGVAQLNGNQTFAGPVSFSGIVNFLTNSHMNDQDLYLRWDENHGLGWYGAGKPFAGVNLDGPVMYGYSGGGLGTMSGGQKLSLTWDNTGKLAVDPNDLNNGTLVPGLSFGRGSGEGISSKRTATGNQFGLDFYTGYANRMSITQNGNVGIGTNSPSVRLEVAGTSAVTTTSDGFVDIGPANSWHITMGTQDIQVKNTPRNSDTLYLNWYGGNVSVAGTNLYVSAQSGVSVNTRYNNGYRFYVNGSTYSTGGWGSSDARWKKNVQPIAGSLEKVMRLQGVNFDWKREEFPELDLCAGRQLGFIAQDVEKVVPEAVRTDTAGYKAIAYEKLTAVLNEAIKEQQSQIEDLRTRNAKLEREMAELKSLVLKLAQ